MSSGACPCETCQDPHSVQNQPGLGTIAYRVDDFSGFRRALLRPLAGEQALLGWRPAPGDLGLQLLEWWAYLADILTFYNERIANEDYLRTAELPTSVTGLVGLLGYRPRPAIGAVGQVAALRRKSHPSEPLVIPDRVPALEYRHARRARSRPGGGGVVVPRPDGRTDQARAEAQAAPAARAAAPSSARCSCTAPSRA